MKARYFFIIAIVAVLVAGWQAGVHQHYAQSLVTAATAKDTAGLDTTGDQEVVKGYVQSHMGTVATIFLAGSYNRAASAAQAASNPSSNGQIYAQAQAACASHADSIAQAHCVTAYVNSHSQPSSNPQAAVMPNKADYTKTFRSPGWTPDSTGIAIAVAVVAAVLGVALNTRRTGRR